MTLTGNIMINTFSILILIILLLHGMTYSQRHILSARLYNLLLIVTGLLLVFDIFSRFDGNPGTLFAFVNQAGNFLVFLASLLPPSVWLLYAHERIFHDTKKLRKLVPPLIAVNAANAALVVISQFTGWYYEIDASNIYRRGPLFWLPATVTFVLLLIVFILALLNRKTLTLKQFYPLILFIVPPLLGITLQLLFYGLSIMLSSIVLSLLIVFINTQGTDSFTDYLTGVSNRKRLDIYMMDKIKASGRRSTFSAIMLDIDNFKKINDTYGHDIGDKILADAADLLSKCLRANDFVARVGGDEFMVVLDCTDILALEQTVKRIRQRIRQYNETCVSPFVLDFSMGYSIYDANAQSGMAAFQKELDERMYEEKRRKSSDSQVRILAMKKSEDMA